MDRKGKLFCGLTSICPVVALCSLILIGCGESANQRRILGTWKLETPSDSVLSDTIEFGKDGTWSETYIAPWGKDSANGTWQLSNATLVQITQANTTFKARIGKTERSPILRLDQSVLVLKKRTKDGKEELATYRPALRK
jgi:hypothetical protein